MVGTSCQATILKSLRDKRLNDFKKEFKQLTPETNP
jgi:hypothetical protein